MSADERHHEVLQQTQRHHTPGAALIRLDHAEGWVREGDALARSGRAARTLIKNGPLRVTLIVLGPGGGIAEHRAEGPITVQPLAGAVRFHLGATVFELAPGDLFTLDSGVPHAVDSLAGGTFLLTVAAPSGEPPRPER